MNATDPSTKTIADSRTAKDATNEPHYSSPSTTRNRNPVCVLKRQNLLAPSDNCLRISISKATWTPIYRKCAGNPTLLNKRMWEYMDLVTKINVAEIIQAWVHHKPVNRKKILQNLEKTLGLYSNDRLPEIMNENSWLESMELVKDPLLGPGPWEKEEEKKGNQ